MVLACSKATLADGSSRERITIDDHEDPRSFLFAHIGIL